MTTTIIKRHAGRALLLVILTTATLDDARAMELVAEQPAAGGTSPTAPDSLFFGERSSSTQHEAVFRASAVPTFAADAGADRSQPDGPVTIANQSPPHPAALSDLAPVGDGEGPVVVHLPPAEVVAGVQIQMTASVTDAAGVAEVKLAYRLAASSPWEFVALTLDADGQYRATIGPFPLTTTMAEYFIDARDQDGNLGSFGTATDPIELPVRRGRERPPEPAAASAMRFAVALPIALLAGWLYRVSNHAPTRAQQLQGPATSTLSPTRSTDPVDVAEVDRAFWRRLLSPLTSITGHELDAALAELSRRTIRHPVYGRRTFPAGYLRTKLADLTMLEPVAPAAADSPAKGGTVPSPSVTGPELEFDLDRPASGVDFDWLEQLAASEEAVPSPTTLSHIEPSCLLNAAVVSADPEELRRMTAMLEEFDLFVETARTATEALDLVFRSPYRLLVVRYPLPDIKVDSFLLAIREPNSPCRQSSVILLADGEDRADAERCIGRGANRILDLAASQQELQTAADGLLNIANRRRTRLLARVEPMTGAKDVILCQTENISATGMLINTDRRYPLGTACRFEFRLPDEETPMQGMAEVVRHTTADREQIGGIGLRFVSFSGNSRARFEAHLLRA